MESLEGVMTEQGPGRGFRVEIDPDKLEDAFGRLREGIEALPGWAERSVEELRHTQVRVFWKGRQVGPDLPLHLVLAGEGAALVLMGPLRLILANLGARALLEVRLVHASERLVTRGKEAWAEGEAEEAERCFREALVMRPEDPAAHYQLALILRVTGRVGEAREHLGRAAAGPPELPEVAKAADLLARLGDDTSP